MTAAPLRMRTARFAELTGAEVYGLCRLRVDVFVVEQQCPYPELDGRDVEPGTVHLWFADEDGGIAATIRVLDDGDTRAIGRVATAAAHRGEGLAARLIEAGIALCEDVPITLGAQAHLEGWYARFGFVRSGPGYVEDGIPHVPMRRAPAASDPPAPPWRPGPEARREPLTAAVQGPAASSRVAGGTGVLHEEDGVLPLLRTAADRLEALAARTTPGDWRVGGLLATRPEVVAHSAEGGTEHVAEARAGTGAWIAALSPALAAPLAGWLRAAAAGGPVDPAAEAFARALLARLP
jgi:predicted GNAT family N-acyltransferase